MEPDLYEQLRTKLEAARAHGVEELAATDPQAAQWLKDCQFTPSQSNEALDEGYRRAGSDHPTDYSSWLLLPTHEEISLACVDAKTEEELASQLKVLAQKECRK